MTHIYDTLISSLHMNGPNKLVLRYTGPGSLARDKHSSLLGPYVSFEENKVL